jgi:hypothetical protein
MTEKARTGGKPRREPEYLHEKSISIAKASKKELALFHIPSLSASRTSRYVYPSAN